MKWMDDDTRNSQVLGIAIRDNVEPVLNGLPWQAGRSRQESEAADQAGS
ncbi:MAG: hypothetical protein ABIR84_03740 [Candidatus Nitrotoga sp.]